MKLHIGCGERHLPGFINIDVSGRPDVKWDVRKGLPYNSNSVRYIYAEHFLEHLAREEGLCFLAECRRVLMPGGVLRIATPDLDETVRHYVSDDWRNQEWLKKYPYGWIPNRAVMLNLSLREWGHQYLYNREDLLLLGRLAGFLLAHECRCQESSSPELAGLESRSESFVLEFTKESAAHREELPLVSIVIPASRDKFFSECIRSALAQTYLHTEIIVCNDNPSSRIEAIVQEFGDRPEVRLINNDRNLGSLLNNLQCLRLASGPYVKFLNDDDLLAPDCVRRMVCCFEAFGPRVALVTSRRAFINEDGELLKKGSTALPLVAADSLIDGKDLGDFFFITRENLIGEPTTVMFRKADLPEIPLLTFQAGGAELQYAGDIWMWLLLLSKGDAVYLVEPLSSFRLHESQEQHSPPLIFLLLTVWSQLLSQARPLGFLASEETRALALDIYCRSLKGWLEHPDFNKIFSESQQKEIAALREKTEEELKAILVSSPKVKTTLSNRPSLSRQLEKIHRSEGWFPPLRHVHLGGKLIRTPAPPPCGKPSFWSRLRSAWGKKTTMP